jgi:hypothetical protein
MNRLIVAMKETAKYWGVPVAVAFVIEYITTKENQK